MTEITEEMVKAAHEAYAKTTGGLLAGHPMRNALSALDAAGYAVVPKEPDDAMKVAGGLKMEAMLFEGDPDYTGVIFNDVAHVYRAMLSAAQVKP